MAYKDLTKEQRAEIDERVQERLAFEERLEEKRHEQQPAWKEGDQNRRKADRRKPPAPAKKKSGFFDL
jgi:hypothetical protein